MAKTNKPTMKPEKAATTVTMYMDMYSFRERPLPPEFFEDEAKRMVDFFRNSDHAFTLGAYLVERGFHRQTFYRWIKRHKVLNKAYEFSKEIIANRRETGMLLGELKEKPNMFMLHHYNADEWNLADKRWSDLSKKEDANKQQNITVVMESFSKSDKKTGAKENHVEKENV